MFDRAISAIRHATGNRFTPCISLMLSAASFVLTLLLILPATKGGDFESFHLITLNTSNIGQDIFNFSPTNILNRTSNDPVFSLEARRAYDLVRERSTTITTAQTIANTTNVNGTTTNLTTTTITVSLPAPTQAPTGQSIESILLNFIQSFGPSDNNQLGEFIQRILTNITSGILRSLSRNEGGLGQIISDIIRNVTTRVKEEISKAETPVLQQILQGLVTGKHNESLSTSHDVTEFIDGILGNFSTGISDGLSKAQGKAASGIANALGIQQFYTIHLRQICSGMFSNTSDPNAVFDIFGCFTYPEAAKGLTKLIANLPSSATVLSTNVSIPAFSQASKMQGYLTSLGITLSKTIFSFYLLSIIGSAAIFLGSLLGFLFPASPAIMYSNLAFSLLSSFAGLAGSATVTAFVTTACNIINIFGSSLGVHASVGSPFLIMTWASFGLTLLTNWYVLGLWFFQFRTIEVKVQRRSPHFIIPPVSPRRLVETVETSGETVPTINTISTFNSKTSFHMRRGSKRQSQYANF